MTQDKPQEFLVRGVFSGQELYVCVWRNILHDHLQEKNQKREHSTLGNKDSVPMVLQDTTGHWSGV